MSTQLQLAQSLRANAHALTKSGDLAGAVQLLRLAVQHAPEAPMLRLELGEVLQSQNDWEGATRAYFLAVMKARARGQWLNNETVPEAIFERVHSAMAYVEKHRDEVFFQMLAPEIARYGSNALKRVTQALNIYLQRDLTRPANPLQRPLSFYMPGLREQPFYQPSEFAWTEAAMQAQADIASEADRAIASGVEPFLGSHAPVTLGNYLAGNTPKWDAYFLYRHGQAFDQHLQACPATSQFLQQIDRVEIDAHAPEICFSVLAPDTHILPHTGVTNTRLVAHLPLRLPESCALKVAGIEKPWQLSEPLIFDDTFEHEAWNRSTEPRVILLMDVWHPDLHHEERAVVRRLIQSIGHFNRGA
jgi:aspartate beta-hydroxylase